MEVLWCRPLRRRGTGDYFWVRFYADLQGRFSIPEFEHEIEWPKRSERANRGEIAVHVARTADALGLCTVAVFGDADAGALHVDVAEIAVGVTSYLEPAALLDAARTAGARAVHPACPLEAAVGPRH